MAKPQILQKLRHGKLLCGAVFSKFVETWNYLIDRVENLKGDADTNPQYGHIKIDNTDPEHPVVRLVNFEDFGKGESGGGGGGTTGAFSYDEETNTITDGMYLRGRQWVRVSDTVVSASGYAYLQVDMGTSGTATIITGASSLPNPNTLQTYIPLYVFDEDLKVKRDYRGAPTVQIWEY